MKEMILIRFTSSSKLENNELLNSILIAMIGINTIAIMKMRAFWAPNLMDTGITNDNIMRIPDMMMDKIEIKLTIVNVFVIIFVNKNIGKTMITIKSIKIRLKIYLLFTISALLIGSVLTNRFQ